MRIVIILLFVICILVFAASIFMWLPLLASSHHIPAKTYLFNVTINISSLLGVIIIYGYVKIMERKGKL